MPDDVPTILYPPLSRAQALSLLALRLSLGALMLVWGIDKVVNPAHGLAVAERFYLGVLADARVMPAIGIAQIVLGLLVIAGVLRKVTYPALALTTGITLLGVWRSVVDPWGWALDGTNALFFPSLIVFTGNMALLAFRDADRMTLDRTRR